MNIETISITFAIALMLARVVLAIRRREPLHDTGMRILLTGFSGVSMGVGSCGLFYYYFKNFDPSMLVTFYKGWHETVWFVFFGSLAYLLGGTIGVIKIFRPA